MKGRKTMKLKRLICFVLVLSFCLVPLWSCNDGSSDDLDGGGLNDDGSVNWDEVDFKGTTVKFAISAAQDKAVRKVRYSLNPPHPIHIRFDDKHK